MASCRWKDRSAAEGRAAIENWIANNFRKELRGASKDPVGARLFLLRRLREGVHLVNLASVRALEEKLGRPVDPLRFRPNIVIEGAPAFSELDWIEKEIRLPGLTLAGVKRYSRCAATNVDPKTGARDMQIPRSLDRGYGHEDFGIYLVAMTGGGIAVGDRIEMGS